MKRSAENTPPPETTAQAVLGERSTPVIARALSMQARISNFFGMTLMALIAGGLLLWYYSHQLTRQGRMRQGAQVNAARLAAAEMALPPLGAFDTPPVAAALQSSQPPDRALPSGTGVASGAVPPLLPLLTAASVPTLALEAGETRAVKAHTGATPIRPLDRRLMGAAFLAAAPDSAANSAPPAAMSGPLAPASFLPGASTTAIGAPEHTAGATADMFGAGVQRWPAQSSASAYLLPTQSLLLPKGAFIDCTLETAIDSSLPGLTSCVTATDTFGADGHVVLLERGTKLVGETQGQVQQGAARVFVLWSEARTPLGVIVPLESPGADELGRAGLPGTVQRHFWERFGAAIMMSTIDGAVQAAVESSSHNGGTVIYNPGASQDVMTEVLKSTVAIPPTVVKRNGDRIQVLVARDVDFRAVYELRRAR